VEDADVGILEAQRGEPELAAPHHDRVEAGRHEVPGHPVRDDAVVLDDQDLGHGSTIVLHSVWAGFRRGDDLVKRLFASRPEEQDVVVETADASEPVEAEETYGPSPDELRTGSTAAVSQALRTPLARILALLDTMDLPDADVHELVELARGEVEGATALIDEILFLSEL